MKRIVVFDFDGTITQKDTLLEFIKFTKGHIPFYWGVILNFPWLIAMKFQLYPNWKAKQKFFSYFFKGLPIETFEKLCVDFFNSVGKSLLYKGAIEKIKQHMEKADEVIIISASIENWIRPFANYLGIKNVIATQIELNSGGYLTGSFISKNCYGKEKVNRLLTLYPQRNNYYLIAYGDSRGDFEILNFADESFYRLF